MTATRGHIFKMEQIEVDFMIALVNRKIIGSFFCKFI
jgi:hypothetical protein